MPNPFSSPSISGYNPGPPPDDGSQVASNLATWADIKNELSDPVKSLVETAISNTSTAFGKIFGNNVSAVSATYSVVAGDQGKILSCTNTITLNLLAAATASSNFTFVVWNGGTGVVTLDGNASETINGATTLAIQAGCFAIVSCNGSAWTAIGTFPETIIITSTDAGATVGPTLDLYRDSASPLAGDIIGQVQFNGEDSAGNKQLYGRIYGVIDDPTSTSEDAHLVVETIVAGTAVATSLASLSSAMPKYVGRISALGSSPPTQVALVNLLGTITLTRNATGNFTFGWVNVLNNTNVQITSESDSVNAPRIHSTYSGEPPASGASGFRIISMTDAGVAVDVTSLFLVIWGDLA